MVPDHKHAANDVIKICTCQFQSCCNFFPMHLPKVHVSEFILKLVVSKLCHQSILSAKSQNETRTCSVLEREKKSKNLKINGRIRSWFMV